MSELLQAALAYAALGFKVFPLHGVVDGRCTCRKSPEEHVKGRKPGKHPATEHGLKEATDDPDQIRKWWRRNPRFNVGIATGEASGFWVLDVDGEDGANALDALETVNGRLPQTVGQMTGGGRHVCFRWDPDGPEIRNRGRIGKVPVDARGNGGYIVAPPSVHMSGRRYAWWDGCAPGEIAFADAPAWLVELAKPRDTAPAPPIPAAEPRRREGRASRYGEKALDNAVASIRSAQKGSRDTTLFLTCVSIGKLVAGEEIERDYARETLIAAGRVHVPDAMTEAQLVRQVDRALDSDAARNEPKRAPERRPFEPAVKAEAAPTPAQEAIDIRDARALWDSARSADCGAFRTWLKVRGLEPEELPGALQRLRAHPTAPLGGGKIGPAMLAPLVRDPEDLDWGHPVDALAILPLFEGADRFTTFVGTHVNKACPLVGWSEGATVVVAIDLQDAWALGAAAHVRGNAFGVVVAPTLRSFAGNPLGDRWKRIDPVTPHADPEQAPWTDPRVGDVWLAVRGDLRASGLKYRKRWGGTGEANLEGEAAARFWGGLAEQAWRRAGANAVRILRPQSGPGFNSQCRSVGA